MTRKVSFSAVLPISPKSLIIQKHKKCNKIAIKSGGIWYCVLDLILRKAISLILESLAWLVRQIIHYMSNIDQIKHSLWKEQWQQSMKLSMHTMLFRLRNNMTWMDKIFFLYKDYGPFKILVYLLKIGPLVVNSWITWRIPIPDIGSSQRSRRDEIFILDLKI